MPVAVRVPACSGAASPPPPSIFPRPRSTSSCCPGSTASPHSARLRHLSRRRRVLCSAPGSLGRAGGACMASGRRKFVALGLSLIAAGAGAYLLWPRGEAAPIVGVVRATQVRVAPEVGGQLATIKVHKGDRVRAGDLVAELSALELS